jgi:hypothetical protein
MVSVLELNGEFIARQQGDRISLKGIKILDIDTWKDADVYTNSKMIS